MGSGSVVVDPPFVDTGARVAEGQEPGRVEAFLTEPAVDRLDVGVIARSSLQREGQLDLVEVSPLIEQPSDELGPVV